MLGLGLERRTPSIVQRWQSFLFKSSSCDHLLSVAIQLEKKLAMPDEPPFNLPKSPEIQPLGTIFTLLESVTIANQEKINNFKRDVYTEL